LRPHRPQARALLRATRTKPSIRTRAQSSVDVRARQGVKGFHLHARAVIQAYYPAPQDPSILDWAERTVLWNTLQILALQGSLDISALVSGQSGAARRSGSS
jgi:hypothetical protein